MFAAVCIWTVGIEAASAPDSPLFAGVQREAWWRSGRRVTRPRSRACTAPCEIQVLSYQMVDETGPDHAKTFPGGGTAERQFHRCWFRPQQEGRAGSGKGRLWSPWVNRPQGGCPLLSEMRFLDQSSPSSGTEGLFAHAIQQPICLCEAGAPAVQQI